LDKRVNVAVVGLGYWGSKLAREYLELSKERRDVRLTALVDVSKDKLSNAVSNMNLLKSMLHTDYSELLKNSAVDVVHIATPSETHFKIASEFLEAGKHVLLEKPMTVNQKDASKLARMAENSDSILSVGHIFRFNNALMVAKELINDRVLGDPYYAELRWVADLNPPPRRNIIFDLAPHPVDIVNCLFDEWPSREVK